ncbi:hypothetical protein MTO96_005703 [Rhipicephalus appendiculatus]
MPASIPLSLGRLLHLGKVGTGKSSRVAVPGVRSQNEGPDYIPGRESDSSSRNDTAPGFVHTSFPGGGNRRSAIRTVPFGRSVSLLPSGLQLAHNCRVLFRWSPHALVATVAAASARLLPSLVPGNRTESYSSAPGAAREPQRHQQVPLICAGQ